jgi:enoyl reductase-like protein
MTRQPLTSTESQFVSDSLASIAHTIAGHVPDLVAETLDRLIEMMSLPRPRRWQRFRQVWSPPRLTERITERLTEDEIGIILAWFESVESIYADRVSYRSMELSHKLMRELRSLVEKDCRALWKEFDNDVTTSTHVMMR